MAQVTHGKIIIDASGERPGRLATKIAIALIGKHKASYTPHIDDGSKVVVVHADRVVFSGKKIEQKVYRHHSMHPGGLKETPAKKVFKDDPKEVIRHAVARMLPRNKFHTNRMKRLQFK